VRLTRKRQDGYAPNFFSGRKHLFAIFCIEKQCIYIRAKTRARAHTQTHTHHTHTCQFLVKEFIVFFFIFINLLFQ